MFRSVDVELAALQLWGSLEWMWVWFDPTDSRTPQQVGAAFVDVFLGGLLLDRLGLSKWTDPATDIVAVVRDSLAAVTGRTD